VSRNAAQTRIAVFRERTLVNLGHSSEVCPTLYHAPPSSLVWRRYPEFYGLVMERYRQGIDRYIYDALRHFCGAVEYAQEVSLDQLREFCDVIEETFRQSAPQRQLEREIETEVLRLIRDATCRFCRSPMRAIPYFGDRRVFVCPTCGYWGGRGEDDEHRALNSRAVLGAIHRVNLDSLRFPELVGHLQHIPDHLLKLSPQRAEQVVMDLLRESLDCEVRTVGGTKDWGVDGYIIRNDNIKTIVQVKWHRDTQRAESVRVIREIAGTLVARGVPSGLLVTTRNHLSREAQLEIDNISKHELTGLGSLTIGFKSYNDILDMLDLAWTRMGADFEATVQWLSEPNRQDLFDTWEPPGLRHDA
jgi:hypothetical protein